ncbi:hypothetical protein MLD38_024648 [Melastoma candidum]|uniref:Uncharacterized protein n=1 Tax=Melastoma candidum TaxID=119954 RepID=A0ACB9NVZ2_9MYRT|nr:hypothetical protein MLD38_024648 [Melastoma candidum]
MEGRPLPHPFFFFFFFFFILFLSSSAAGPPYSCHPSFTPTRSLPFCRTSLPISARVKDLVSRLTLDEKISQLGNTAPSIPRLGIPSYEWWSESLHGVSQAGKGVTLNTTIKGATSFPQVILTAASFSEDLWYRIGRAIGTEARAVYNAGETTGMTFWAPNINVFRDPRGTPRTGRGARGGGRLQASACCKHFTAYDLDHWKGINRFVFDAKVTAQDMADTFQPPFQRCIQDGRASGIMCAYNRVNGVPSCANYDLLSGTARAKWNFHGYITSDCDAVSIMYENQGYAKTPEDAVAVSLKAGMDVNCGSYLQTHTKSAIYKKKLPESQIDRALHNLFSVRMRLGLFDGDPSKLPFGYIGPNQACSREHLELAHEAARRGFVLLKNDRNRLPLQNSKSSSLAVIGPNANSAWLLLGNYAGPPCTSVTILQALQLYGKDAKYLSGCDTVACSNAAIDEAVALAKEVDDVVLVMGLNQTEEAEDHDRVDLVLPGRQQELISAVARAAKKPIVLVLICGGPVDVRFARDDENIGGIVWAGYPGEAGGYALVQVIFGDHNPEGKLPVTWYPQEFTRVPMTDMRMRPDPSTGYPGRTYRFYRGQTVFEFGYGLHYTKYSYKFTSLTKETFHLNSNTSEAPGSARQKPVSELGVEFCERSKSLVTVEVENQGDMAGRHPVLLFLRRAKPTAGSPVKQLVDFQSVELKAGERVEIEFKLNPCEHFSRANEDGMMVMEEGWHFLVVENEEYPVAVLA